MTAAYGQPPRPANTAAAAANDAPALTAGARVLLARENLCLAMALFAASHQGLITTAFVPARADIYLQNGDVVDYAVPLELTDNAALVRCAGNQIRGAFALCVLQTQRELASGFPDLLADANEDANEFDADLRAAGAAVYLIARSVERDLIAPRWDIPPDYRRTHAVPAFDFALDATRLDGQAVRWEHFGGLPRFLDLTRYLARRLDESEPVTGPGEYGIAGDLAGMLSSDAASDGPPVIQPGFGSGAGRLRRPDAALSNDALSGNALSDADTLSGWVAPTAPPEPRFGIAAPAAEAGPVGDFVTDACATDAGAMTLASALYTSYAAWCLDNGYLSVSQRKFGLELTAQGYQRKRRGKGRHWWVGLQPRD